MALQEGKLLAEATLSQTPAERLARERYATLAVGRSSARSRDSPVLEFVLLVPNRHAHSIANSAGSALNGD